MDENPDAAQTKPPDGASARASLVGWFDLNDALNTPRGSPTIDHTAANRRALITARGLQVAFDPERVRVAFTADSLTVIIGEPRNEDFESVAAAEINHRLAQSDHSEPASWLRGHFSVVHINLKSSCCLLVSDRFSVFRLCYGSDGKRFAFADRADAVPVSARTIDPQAVYNYLYFHVIPAPRTIFREVLRLEPATQLNADQRGIRSAPTWSVAFGNAAGFDSRVAAERFRSLLRAAVKREMSSTRVGAYLSGGTDSSTVAGMLTQITQDRVDTFSIGFEAVGYDEMAYARIAAKHFDTRHHEYYVTPADVALAIPIIAAGYDQPFGNSSAVPAFFCAKMAHDHGITRLLAGDGGDELFGGNVRYARQKLLELYHAVPPSFRARLIEPLLLGSTRIGKLPLLRKAASYVEQARTPMPKRAEFYN
ncbi:MAG TPA: asparagine synthase-related protein, partial [Burkholderiaceae bacterium]|nr:asparagine synthase-related protein [Burkholderiaceae bacterium]